MTELQELTIADLKALYDYYSLIIKDELESITVDENVIIDGQTRIYELNHEIKKRIKKINFE